MPKNKSKKSEDELREEEKRLASWVNQKFKDAMIAKDPYTSRWLNYLNAWDNSLYEDAKTPSYKTNHVSNFIYSTIESMRPILFDQDPRFECIPVTAEGMPYSNDITTILDWEWHRTNMQEICLANSIYTFALGTSVIMLKYEYKEFGKSEVDGEVAPVKVSPFNLFPDPLATSVEDAEYIIYADYMHVNRLKKKYPSKAEFLQGGDVQFPELVNDRSENARIDNQVLVLEMWCRDYTIIDIEENGEKKKKIKYPKGRVILVAPELGLVLEDKQNPYDTGRFPFFLFKDIDVPFQFWGEGEVKWLLSPQQEANDLYNQIIDNAKHTANMQWVIDKNAGIPKGELTNRPGLIVRKNPGSEVRRDSPPAMPMYVHQMIDTLKSDIEVISGVHDVTRGQTPTGIQSAAAIVALQEAAQIRVRLKVTLHENALGVLGTEWLERIKQFWKFNRVVPKKVDESKLLPPTVQNGMERQPAYQLTGAEPTYQMLEINPDVQLNHDYVVKVVGASVMQSSRASMLDQMIKLISVPAEDGMPCVPREAVLDYLPNVNKRLILQYFQKLKEERMQQEQSQQMGNDAMQQLQMLAQQVQELGNALGNVQQRIQQDDEAIQRDEIMAQGYQQGMNEAKALQTQINKSGQLPPELLDELDQLDEEALNVVLQQNPEILDMLQNVQ
jgi:hypothetical protein